ncbi:hypothetical protein Ancab_006339 [Ancistrocladus abbreviatus]
MEDDERREAAIASNPCLRPNFKPPGITQNQLNKFQEFWIPLWISHCPTNHAKADKARKSHPLGYFCFVFSKSLNKELHRRRLQIKSKIKTKKKPKDEMGKFQEEIVKKKDCPDENSDQVVKASCAAMSSSDSNDVSSFQKVDINHILKKRQKLHWGLDVKERWERKANM